MRVETSSKDVAMSDVALAADRIRLVAGPRGFDEPKKALLERAYQALAKVNRQWTRRRVRALFNQEAARVEYREIREMEHVIALQAARRDHAEFIAETKRLATALAARDEAFFGPEIERLRGVTSGVDRARAETASED